MRILAIADTVHELVHSPAAAERFKDVDLVLSCGDLPFDYIEFVVSILNKPLLYVFGNHNTLHRRFGHEDIKVEPEGATNLHGRVLRQGGLLIGGLEGSMRYRDGPHQYTDLGMRLQMWRMVPRLLWNRVVHRRALDILVTHAPPRGVHDGEDCCHQGFPALLWFIRWFKPRHLLHGHTHLYRLDAERVTRVGDTEVINCYGYQLIDVSPPPRRRGVA